jgi:hypothetical protein
MSVEVVWICGKHRGETPDGVAWDLQGVFETEAGAIAACVETRDFIGPAPLNQRLPQSATNWPGCRFPLAG